MLGEVTGRAAIHFPFCFLLLFFSFSSLFKFFVNLLAVDSPQLANLQSEGRSLFFGSTFPVKTHCNLLTVDSLQHKNPLCEGCLWIHLYLRPIAWFIGRSTSHWLDQDIRRVSLAICQALGLPRARQGSPRRENESRRYVRPPTTRNQTESLLTWQCECGMFQTIFFFIIIEAWRSTYSNIMERRHLWHTI